MKVYFDKFPENYQFFSRENDGANVRVKGRLEKEEDIEFFITIKVTSEINGLDVARYVDYSSVKDEFDITVRVPSGYNYRLVFDIVRKNDEEWIEYRKVIHHIGVGDVFVIAGQSNAVGYGKGSYVNTTDERIYNFKFFEKWDIASNPTHDLNGYTGKTNRDSGEYGPHINMAKKIINCTNIPIAFIPCAVGGTSITRWNKRQNGDLYYEMLERIKTADVKVSGVLWYQGESDANLKDRSDKYYNMLAELIGDMREDLNIPELRFYIYQININKVVDEEYDEGWNLVREAQRCVSLKDNVFAVPTFGAELMCDGIHNNPIGCDLVGERMACVILNSFYKVLAYYNVPTAIYSLKISNNEISVIFNEETHFVYKESYRRVFDFKVFDIIGENEIKEIRFNNNIAYIKLNRNMFENCVVYGAYGSNPKNAIPLDYVSEIPMLGFKLNVC